MSHLRRMMMGSSGVPMDITYTETFSDGANLSSYFFEAMDTGPATSRLLIAVILAQANTATTVITGVTSSVGAMTEAVNSGTSGLTTGPLMAIYYQVTSSGSMDFTVSGNANFRNMSISLFYSLDYQSATPRDTDSAIDTTSNTCEVTFDTPYNGLAILGTIRGSSDTGALLLDTAVESYSDQVEARRAAGYIINGGPAYTEGITSTVSTASHGIIVASWR